MIEEEARLAHRIEAKKMYEVQLANRALQIYNAKIHKRHRVLSTLPTVDYIGKYLRFLRLKHPGTNEWIKDTAQYSKLMTIPSSECLCIYGIPGSGKSVLSSSIVESRTVTSSAGASAVCHYYCDFADPASLDPYCLVATLLKQVLQAIPLGAFSEEKHFPFDEGKPLPSLEVARQFFIGKLCGFSDAYVVLDGIDELALDDQPIVLAVINAILTDHPKAKVIITSRSEEYWLKRAMQSRFSLRLSQSFVGDDIARVLHDELNKFNAPSPLYQNEGLKQRVLESLISGAQEM